MKLQNLKVNNMNTNKKIYSLGIALLVAAAIRPVYAESNDMTQTRTQDHLRSQVNVQTASSEFGQASNSEQKMIFNKNQNQNQNQYQHQYKHMMNTSAKQSGSGEGSGSTMSGSSNQYNTMNRYAQNTGSGSMSRQNSSPRSSGGGGGRR
jgi:hypothetical protein